MRASVARCQNLPGPKKSRSPGATWSRRRRAERGISAACWAAVRPWIARPAGSPESLNTRHAKPEQSYPPWTWPQDGPSVSPPQT